MSNNKFIFNSTKTGEQGPLSILYIPTIIAIIWAGLIIFGFAQNNQYFLLILFIAVFIFLLGFTWPNIWKPTLEFDKEKKILETKLPFSVWAIDEAKFENLVSIEKNELEITIPLAIARCLGGVIGSAIGGIGGGIIVGLIFIGILPGLFAGLLFGALCGASGFVFPGKYITYTLKTLEKKEEKESEKTDAQYKEYVVYIENEADIQSFEDFLSNCLSESNSTLSITNK